MLTDKELQSLRNQGNEAEAAADEIQELRAALRDATDELVAFMNLPTENDPLWIEQEKEDLALIDRLRAVLGKSPWLESLLGPNVRANPDKEAR